MKSILSTQDQIDKLSKLHKLSEKAVCSENFVEKIGGVAIFAGISDFYVIQSARLIEQIILKSELYKSKEPSFEPHEDSYFYDERINSRVIIKKIRNILPFRYESDTQKEKEINLSIASYLDKTGTFLNYRNPILHHIASPKISESKFEETMEKAISSFHEMMEAHRTFFKLCQPYRFGLKEIKYFYNKK